MHYETNFAKQAFVKHLDKYYGTASPYSIHLEPHFLALHLRINFTEKLFEEYILGQLL